MNRKHEWESTTKKASHRSWEKGLFVVLKKSSVTVFKDQKHYIQEPGKTYRGEAPADLKGAVAAVPPDYTKRKNVFRLKLANGAEFLFEAKSPVCVLSFVLPSSVLTTSFIQEDMNNWISRLNQAIGDLQRSPSSRTQTLPARAGSQEGEERKKAAKKTKTMLPG